MQNKGLLTSVPMPLFPCFVPMGTDEKRLPLSRELAAQPTEGEYIGVLVAFAGVESDSMVVFVEVELDSVYHLRCTA